MPRYIVSEQLKDGWFGRASIIAVSSDEAIRRVKKMLGKSHDRWKTKTAKKATER